MCKALEAAHVPRSRFLGEALATWPHLVARGSGKCTLWLGGHVPSYYSIIKEITAVASVLEMRKPRLREVTCSR